MDCKEVKEQNSEYDFKLGDLIKYVRVEKANIPQTWIRSGGVGILVSSKDSGGSYNYTVMTGGKLISCLEIFPFDSTEKVCNVYEFKNI